MSDLVQTVTDGILENTASSVYAESSGNELGKDAFLQLLCTQLQYQDPLNPSSDTEFVSQLAQYSQLEELQNLTAVQENQQALSLVGKTVIINTTSTSGTTTQISGTVDYIIYDDGEFKLSIDDTLYSMDDLYSVIDDTYIIEQGLPGIDDAVTATYDKDNPSDISFEVNVGSGDTVATQVAIMLNGSVVDSDYVSLNDGVVTISADAFADLDNGTYTPTIIFNDYYYTTVSGKITITVTGTGTTSSDTTTSDTTEEDTTTDTTTDTDDSTVSTESVDLGSLLVQDYSSDTSES